MKGDVPVMMMLWRKKCKVSFNAVRQSATHRNSLLTRAHHGGKEKGFRHSLITYPASDRYTTPAHSAY